MITVNADFYERIRANPRSVDSYITVTNYSDSTSVNTYWNSDNLVKWDIEGTASNKGKLIGNAISAKLTVELLDKDNTVEINRSDIIKVYVGFKETNNFIHYQDFYVDEFKKDTVNKTINITCYDYMNQLEKIKIKDIPEIDTPCTFRSYILNVFTNIGCNYNSNSLDLITIFNDFELKASPNLSGEETIRNVLEKISEAVCSNAVINSKNEITFKSGLMVQDWDNYIIEDNEEYTQEEYYSDLVFDINTNKLDEYNNIVNYIPSGIALTRSPIDGDDISIIDKYCVGLPEAYKLIIDNNPFLDYAMSDNTDTRNMYISELFKFAKDSLMLYVTPYSLDWRDTATVEAGDYIFILLEELGNGYIAFNNFKRSYDGGLRCECSMSIPEETSNPTTYDKVINKTYVMVDKANQKINELVENTYTKGETDTLLQTNREQTTESIISEVSETYVNKEEYNTASSRIEQKVDNININLSTNGYRNLINNSVGINGLKEWVNSDGNVNTVEVDTVSGSAFQLPINTVLEQTLKLSPEKDYTISFKVRNITSTSGILTIKLNSDSYLWNTETISSDTWIEYSETFKTENQENVLHIENTGGTIQISDLIISLGNIKVVWTQSDNELFTSNIMLSNDGLAIGNNYTEMNSEITTSAFRIKRGSEVRINIAPDGTRLQKTIIEDDLTVGALKVLKRSSGADFIVI